MGYGNIVFEISLCGCVDVVIGLSIEWWKVVSSVEMSYVMLGWLCMIELCDVVECEFCGFGFAIGFIGM